MPPTERPRKRFLVFAGVVVLLGAAAVGVVAAVGRNDGGKSSPRVAPPVRSQASTSTTSRAEATTTIAPAPAPSAPISFTVHSSCGGRDCEVAARERPSTAAKTVGSLRSGEVVQISCSTHGDRINDRHTGQQSDVWYRLATGGYSSALYLQGPTLQDCGERSNRLIAELVPLPNAPSPRHWCRASVTKSAMRATTSGREPFYGESVR
jgi:hypothetical protein